MTMGKRAIALAELAASYSLDIRPGEILVVQAEPEFIDFAKQIETEAYGLGAKEVILDVETLDKTRALIERSNDEELKKEGERLCGLMNGADAMVLARATTNPFYLKGVEPEKIKKHAELVLKPFRDSYLGNGTNQKEKKWCVAAYPCKAHAELAGMPFQEYENLVYSSVLLDWNEETKKMKKMKRILDDADEIRIVVPGETDLSFSFKGRGCGLSRGKNNLPGGEVFGAPVDDSANGYIRFPYPFIKDGNMISGISLELKDGEVINFDAKENYALLETLFKSEGARRLGEAGFGCNYGIKGYTKNLLFDEKIGGTVHITPGLAYTKPLNFGGGINKSPVHMDFICELRENGGKIYVEGELVHENGIWLFDY